MSFCAALQRHADEISEDREIEDWEHNLERLQNLALNEELCDQHLSVDLQEQFQQYLAETAKGESVIQLWKPWWISEFDLDPMILLEDFSKWMDLPISKAICARPAAVNNLHDVLIPSIRTLVTSPPSRDLNDHVIDGLLASCFMLRRFDGDLESDIAEAFSDFFSVSSIIVSSDTRIFAVDDIVSLFLQKAIRTTSFSFCMVIVYDVIRILNIGISTRIYQELLLFLKSCTMLVKSRRKQHELDRIIRKATFFAALDSDLTEVEHKQLQRDLAFIWSRLCSDQEENNIIRDEHAQAKSDLKFSVFRQGSSSANWIH